MSLARIDIKITVPAVAFREDEAGDHHLCAHTHGLQLQSLWRIATAAVSSPPRRGLQALRHSGFPSG